MRWVASIALGVAVASQAGCGIAERAGRGATTGALETLAGKVGDRDRVERLTEGIKRGVAAGALGELSRPERLDDLQRIAAAVAAGTVAGAARTASRAAGRFDGPDERGGRATEGPTPVEAIAAQAARAFTGQMVADLGRAGDGPLATSLSAMTEEVSGSMVRGAQGELFPECRGAGASGCLDRSVERVSRASAAGVAAGMREALGVWPLVFAFAGGALLASALAWATARRPRPPPPPRAAGWRASAWAAGARGAGSRPSGRSS
jgi:hypothetical protein